ncbi:MAG: rRNA maturation RNase YbeY [Candidatus Eisenbacteria sp.]|nr:rRNA maturation RNase YbeY [Candidatus Eisenbacteria bacterium]
MSLRIENRQRVLKLDTRGIRRLVGLILDDHGSSNSDLTVVFARDGLVKELNATYRDVDRTTDVLAFATRDGEPPGVGGDPDELERVLGDVVISTDRAIAQARRYRRTPEREILKLVAHGVLHLVGHDHASTRSRTKMRNLENRYLRTLSKNRQ